MQMQDYLPFFQDLFLEYYQFTLENPVYAGCLAVVVWLLTTIFYSLRIGFLNRRNQASLKGLADAQSALAGAQQEMQQLQGELATGKEQIEQESQRAAALQERIAGLGAHLSESIVGLAAEPELGQQGLSVSAGLEVEHLWQRYSAAVKQLGESLIAQRRTNAELQQAVSAEAAKLAEKEGQLQVMQTRLDSQRQQLGRLESTVEEQKSQLVQQQQSAEQRLAEIEAKHQDDLARLTRLEQQAQEWTQAKERQAVEKPQAPALKVAQAEPVKPVEIKSEVAKPVTVEPERRQVTMEAVLSPAQVAPEPVIARAEAAKEKTETTAKGQQAPSGVAGKFKSLFAGAKEHMEKLDDMFGLNTPMLPPEEPKQTARAQREPAPAPTPVIEPVVAPSVEQPAESAAKEASRGFSGKFKNLFGSSKAPVDAAAAEGQKTVEVVIAEPQTAPEAAVVAAENLSAAEAVKAPGKLKNLFGKFKRTS